MKAKILNENVVFLMNDEEYNKLVYNRNSLVSERENLPITASSEYVEYLDYMIDQASANIDGYLPYKPAENIPKLLDFQGIKISYKILNNEVIQIFTVFDNDKDKVLKGIEQLKKDLSSDDYKIIKCYEASLIGDDLPYNVFELHKKRQEVRTEINRLEALMASNI